MASSAGRPLAGVEVPIPGSDKLDWISLTVPSSPFSDSAGSRDPSGCHVIDDNPQAYIIWRIHKDVPNALELFEISPAQEFPSSGLRLVFKDALYPFAFVYKNEVNSGSTTVYSLLAVTVSGYAFLCNLQSPSSYSPGSTLSANDMLEISIRSNSQRGEISALTATLGCLGSDGITVYSFDLSTEEKTIFTIEPSSYDVPLGEGKAIDLKMCSRMLWILKQVESLSYELIELYCDSQNSSTYKLQEEIVGEQLFQDSDDEHLIWISDALLSFLKDYALQFSSSIFLHGLIQPGIYHSLALRETFLDYKKFLSESQFQSLSLAGIKKKLWQL